MEEKKEKTFIITNRSGDRFLESYGMENVWNDKAAKYLDVAKIRWSLYKQEALVFTEAKLQSALKDLVGKAIKIEETHGKVAYRCSWYQGKITFTEVAYAGDKPPSNSSPTKLAALKGALETVDRICARRKEEYEEMDAILIRMKAMVEDMSVAFPAEVKA